ncbi:unnamed protein product, partial [Musa acuminata var. zebrina]
APTVAIRIRRAKPILSIRNASTRFVHSSSSHPSIASSMVSDLPQLAPDDEAVVSSAVSILRELRSKRRWTFLKSVHLAGFSTAQFAHILLRIRNNPRLALGFFIFSRRHSLCRHDPLSFAAAAHVLARHRRRPAALSLLQAAVRSLDPSSSPYTDVEGINGPPEIFRTLSRTYHAFDSAPFVFDLLVQAYLQVKRLDRAVQIVRILRSRGIQPSIGTSNALIRSVSRAKGSDAGFQIYNHIFKPEPAGCDGVGVKLRVSPNVGTFNTLLLALHREGNLERPKEIRDEMESVGCDPNVFTYSILMAGYCDEGMMDSARGLWEEMAAKGIKPDIMSFNTLISGYCKVEEMERAEDLYRQMILSEIEPTVTTFEQLIKGHCNIGDIDSGLLLYQDMRRRGFGMEVSVVDELLVAMCERRRVAEGLRILRDEMRREEFTPSWLSYEVLIRGLCEEGDVEQALKLQAEMAGKGFGNSFEVYSAFIHGYRKQGDIEKVERLKDEMIVMGVGKGE